MSLPVTNRIPPRRPGPPAADPARIARAALAPLLALVLGSCGSGGEPPRAAGPPPLRVIVRSEPISFLPRHADPVALESEIAAGLARALGRPLELVLEDDLGAMIDRLVAGDGDLVAANLTVTPERSEQVAFSLPFRYVDELLVVRADGDVPTGPEDLAGREIAVRASASYAGTVRELRARVPDLRTCWEDETLPIEDLLERVAAGERDATLVDSNIWDAVADHFPELTAAFAAAEDRPIALALRTDDEGLRRRANEYLIEQALTGRREEIFTDDLPGLKRRGRLRMITRNGAATYFLHRGVQLGFEYELLKRFAEEQGLRLEIVIPPTRAELDAWLLEGRGDVIAASLEMPAGDDGPLAWTRRYATVQRVVVTRADEADGILGPEDLAGMTIHVRAGDARLAPILALREEVGGFEVELAPESLETEDILALVERGVYDATVCDANQVDVARHAGRAIAVAFPLGEADLAWAVRPEDRELRIALDTWLRKEFRGLHYNIAWKRYFEDPDRMVAPDDDWRSDRSGRISPWDELARTWAARTDLDWRLLIAQMYQESRFDPQQVSFAGATGLMQLVPRTAQELGVHDLLDPESSIRGGAQYLRRLIDGFDPKLPLAVRIRFALASYNAGRSHVQDARRLAVQLGLDADRWNGHVEHAMLLLERREYYEQARFGYCRGSECVRYVREVDRRYRTYVRHVAEPTETALSLATEASGPGT